MITASDVREIVSIYIKHGWILRRVLLSPATRADVHTDIFDFPGVAVHDSDVDAMWFSRPPNGGGVPWEIRHLSSAPYALLFTINEHDEGFEESLKSAESVLVTNLQGKNFLDN